MPIDPSIPLQVRPPTQIDPMGVLGKVLTLRNAQQQQQAGALDLQEKQKAIADQQQIADLYKQAFTPDANGVLTLDRNKLTQGLATTGQGDKIPKISASLDAADKATAEARAARADAETKTLDAAGHLAAGVKALGYSPDAFATAVHHMAANQLITPQDAQQYLSAAQQNPATIQAITDHILAQSPKESELASAAATAASRVQTAQTGADRFQAERPKIAADTAKVQQDITGTTPMTPFQQAELQARQAAAAETARHNRVSEAANDQAPTLTPEALKLTAHQFAMTGQLPPMGMGKTGAAVRTAIINKAADEYQGLDLPSQVAAYKANQASLGRVQGTLDNLTAFEKAAGKNIDTFIDLTKNLPDSGVPWVNTPLRLLSDKMVGNQYLPAINAARQIASREVARVVNDPGLKGQLTDNARQGVESMLSGDITIAQLKQVLPVLKNDMANVHSSLGDQLSAIQQRIATPPGTIPSPQPAANAPAFKVGDVVMVGGKKIKISTIHPDGSFDGPEVKQ